MKIIPVQYRWKEIWVGMQAVHCSCKTVLIDSGIDNSISQAVVPELARHNIPLPSVSLVINTHSHDDHTGGNAELRRLTNCRFALFNGTAADINLSGCMKICEDGAEFEIIHTPGHSPDSVCVLEKSSGTLFSGDSIQGCGIKQLGLPLWQDTALYIKSMRKLQSLYAAGKFTRIYAGHEFQPFSGVLHGSETADFLSISIDTAERYFASAQKLKGLALQDFYREILSVFSLSPHPLWKATAVNMADFLLHEAGKTSGKG